LGNIVEGNDYGISYWAYADNNIKGNNMTTNNLAGIWIVGSSYNITSQNIIAGNSQYGMGWRLLRTIRSSTTNSSPTQTKSTSMTQQTHGTTAILRETTIGATTTAVMQTMIFSVTLHI